MWSALYNNLSFSVPFLTIFGYVLDSNVQQSTARDTFHLFLRIYTYVKQSVSTMEVGPEDDSRP